MKHFYYQIKEDKIEVKCNNSLSNKDILDILNQNIKKIERAYNSLSQNSAIKEELLELLFQGKKIEIIETINPNFKTQTAEIKDNELFLQLHTPLDIDTKKIIREFIYKQHAPTLFLDRVEYYANIMNLKPAKVSFRKAKTRWGSCSTINNISLNIALTALPQRLSDYIIIHELAHIKHKNHSKDFWNSVAKYYPNYKEARVQLKDYSTVI